MRYVLIAAILTAGLTVGANAGEEMSPEAFLPAADGKDAYTPAAAFGKDVFLAVWRSGHLAEGDLRDGLKFDAKIVGCRVDKSGKALDAKPFLISAAADLRESPRVAFAPSAGSGQGGGVFLVVWHDLRSGKDWDVYAARVTPEGKVLDPDGILISGGPHNQALPDVAWDGKAFQVVWQDFRSGKRYEICGARVSGEGKGLDPEGSVLAAGKPVEGVGRDQEQFYGPVVASAAADGRSLFSWLLVGVTNRSGASCQFMTDGRATGAPTFAQSKSRTAPEGNSFPASLAAGPKGYLLTWTTHAPLSRGGPASEASAAVLDAEGRLVKLLLLAGGNFEGKKDSIRAPRAAWDGKVFVAAWDAWEGVQQLPPKTQPADAVYAARVGAGGDPGEKVRVSGQADSPAIKPCVASDGAGTTLIAYEKHPNKSDVPIRIGLRMLTAK